MGQSSAPLLTPARDGANHPSICAPTNCSSPAVRSVFAFSNVCQDTAGEERFDALTNFYCRGAACAVVCYDITAHETFTGLARWVDKLRGEENCCIVIVGNKLDAVEQNPSLRKVELAEAKQYATSIGAEVMEVSAKTGTGVSEAFSNVVDTAFERAGRGGRELGQQRDSRRVGVRAQPPQTTNPGGGCAC